MVTKKPSKKQLRRGRPPSEKSLRVRGRSQITIAADVAAELERVLYEAGLEGWSRPRLVAELPRLLTLPAVLRALRAVSDDGAPK